MPISSSFACWLGIVRFSTVSNRSDQKRPVIATSAKGIGL